MTATPKITVVMTAFNEAASIARAIDSILSQTLSDFELIIIDDGSTDSTAKILSGVKDPRVRTILNKFNQGISKSRNEAIDMASGKYIAIFDADDIAMPDRLKKQSDFLDRNPGIALCGTWGVMVSESGRQIFQQPCSPEEIQKAVLKINPVINSTIMARTELLQRFHYDPVFLRHEDYDLILRMLRTHKIANLPEPLIEFETSINLKYKLREHYWKTRARWKAFTEYGYPLSQIHWLFSSLVTPLLPLKLKFIIKELLLTTRK